MPFNRSFVQNKIAKRKKGYVYPRRQRSMLKYLKGRTNVKLRVIATIASNAGGIISFSYTDNPFNFRDWTSVAALYDEYKVRGMKIQYYPYLPNDTSTVTGFLPLFSVYDPNSTGTPLASVNDAVEYENCRQHNMYRPWKRYVKFRRLNAVSGTTVGAGGYIPTENPVATQIMSFYGNGYDISTSYGTVVVTIYLTLRTRK